ncbi:MAG TPA: SDR family oxidoreductase [Candidatus Obscuribacterales bacterium]
MLIKDKTVIVTGSADNIGKAIAFKFAQYGANVVVNARKNVEGGQRVAAQICDAGGKAIFVQADVANPRECARLLNAAQENFGSVDVLINNAGGFEERKFLDSDKEHWLRLFESNLMSAVLCSLEAAKHMKERGGKIINMSSIRGLERGGRPGGIAYSAAKAAIINFTKTLAQELAPDILVNAVAPGFTKTSAFDNVPPEVLQTFLDSTLLKRWLTVDEVADAFFYLATADGITGEVLIIDAGWNAQ